jgi:type IV pilus assembly protein PilM
MRTVGVDIGAEAVRVAVVDGVDKRGRAIVSRIGMVSYRNDVVVGGHVQNKIVAAEALVLALRQARAPRYGFILGYGSAEVATTQYPLSSAIKTAERVTTLRTNKITIAPSLQIEDATLDTNLIRTITNAEGVSSNLLAVVAARTTEVEDLKALMVIARCEPRALDLSAAGLMRALVRVNPDDTDVATIIDIGATKTTISTRQGPHLRSVRVIPKGGADITRAIMGATQETFEQADRRKTLIRLSNAAVAPAVALLNTYGTDHVEKPEEDVETRMDEAVNNVVSDLINRIANTIENDASAVGAARTQAIILSGLTSQIPGLKERISQRIGLEVQLARPWAEIAPSKANEKYLVGGARNPRPLLDLSTAIGLALWKKDARG